MTDVNFIRAIEEMSITAWPSFRQILMDGWIVRFADGYTFRSNSVQPIYPGTAEVVEKIERCEEMYSSAGLPTAFKISPAAQPPELDSLLESRGYRVHTPTSVRVLDTLPEPGGGLGVECVSIDEWLDAFAGLVGLSKEKMQRHAWIVERIPVPICTALVKHEGRAVACGLGMLQGEYIGLFDICTAPSMRRMGLATRVIDGLFSWASLLGAQRAYLSVVEESIPAITLYKRLGFRHVYSYWYRIKD